MRLGQLNAKHKIGGSKSWSFFVWLMEKFTKNAVAKAKLKQTRKTKKLLSVHSGNMSHIEHDNNHYHYIGHQGIQKKGNQIMV